MSRPRLKTKIGEQCSECGSCERYLDGHCCECRRRYAVEYKKTRRYKSQAGLTSKPKSDRLPVPVFDRTIGAAFPAGLSRIMAGR